MNYNGHVWKSKTNIISYFVPGML